jgi:hypothetical protein
MSVKLTHIWAMRPSGAALDPSTFVGDVEPTNVIPYIRQCHITGERILHSLVPTNIWSYDCGLVHRLTDEFTIYSSV